MKKEKVKIIIIIAIIYIVFIIFALFYFNYIIIGKDLIKKDIPEKDCTIIAENSYKNYAWKIQYMGHFICDNGDIYEFDTEGEDTNTSDLFNSEHIEYTGFQVPDNALKELKRLISNIKEMNITKSDSMDRGSWYTVVYNKEKSFVLYQKGDWININISLKAKKALNLLNYYFNRFD